jgi:hypothetical protein
MLTNEKRGRLICLLLFWTGCFAMLVGTGIGIYSCTGLRRRLAALPDLMKRDLSELDRAAGALQSSPLDLKTAVQGGTRMASLIPETLLSLRGTLLQSSETLDALGATAHQTTKGASGMVAPNSALGLDDQLLKKTAVQLRILAGMVGELGAAAAGFRGGVADFNANVDRFQIDAVSVGQVLQSTRNHIQEIQRSIDYVALPMGGALLGVVIGGLYFIMGFLSFSLALIQSSVLRSAEPGMKVEETRLVA